MTQSQAILCALAAFLSWVLVDTSIKLASQAALSPFAIMAILNLAGAFGLIGWAAFRTKLAALRPTHPYKQMWIAGLAIIINYMTITALKHLPLTIFYIVVFTTPLMIAAASAIFLHEVLTKKKIFCLILGFAGVLIVLMPQLGIEFTIAGGAAVGYAAGLLSVACFAGYTLIIRSMSQTACVESTVLWNLLPVGIFGLIFSLSDTATITYKMLAILACGGLLGLLANGLYSKALKHTASSNVAQIHYSQIIFGPLIGYLIWHEIPTWNLLAGAMMIIGAGLAVAAQARKEDANIG